MMQDLLMIHNLDDENSDLVKLLKKERFFFQKEKAGTLPKLFYIVPKTDSYARQSISHDTRIYTWDEYKTEFYENYMKNKRS